MLNEALLVALEMMSFWFLMSKSIVVTRGLKWREKISSIYNSEGRIYIACTALKHCSKELEVFVIILFHRCYRQVGCLGMGKQGLIHETASGRAGRE